MTMSTLMAPKTLKLIRTKGTDVVEIEQVGEEMTNEFRNLRQWPEKTNKKLSIDRAKI